MPDLRSSSAGRHRAPAAASRPRAARRVTPGGVARGFVAVGLVVALGGYTLAESTTQRVALAADRSAVAVATQARVRVAAERDRAVSTARDAVADAAAVRTSASGSVSDAELAPLADAVAALAALVGKVPAQPALRDPALAGRASRGVSRGPVPSAISASLAPTGAASPATTGTAGTASTAGTAGTASTASTAGTASTASTAGTDASPSPGAAQPGAAAGRIADALRGVDDAAPVDTVAAGIIVAAARVAALTVGVRTSAQAADQAAAAAARTTQAAAQAAQQRAAQAAKKAAQRLSLAAYANGRVPASALCPIAFATGQQLRCDAADALAQLNVSYRAQFGANLVVTDSYRSYAAQVTCTATKGSLCATPGTSNHGLGVAVDLGGGMQQSGSKQHAWMTAHAGEFGFDLPDWAGPSGNKPEPWHWEFTG